MKKTALVIMAAGVGSRFGNGIKQLAPVGPNGEIIMDYSIHDAKEAGFNKVVFIIRKDIFKEFEKIIGNRIKEQIDVEYVFQELDDLPEGFKLPEGAHFAVYDDDLYPNHDGIDFYHHYKEDIALLKEMGFKMFRLSISWSRIYPTGEEEKPNQAGLDFYRNVFTELRNAGIEPLVSIWHFDTPLALEDKYGDWLDRKYIALYEKYVTTIFNEYKGLVKYWLTFNEINNTINFLPDNASDEAYQQKNSVMAIGSGQLTGKGLDNNTTTSVKNGNFISEPQTDFIFAVVGEEMGFLGSALIIILLLLITIECIIIAKRAKDLSGRLLCCGVAALIGFQSFVNICVVTGLMPNTGIPLPFVSYGLTSLVSSFIGIGLVLNVGLQPRKYGSGERTS